MPIVSVIIPLYDKGRHIQRALDSVLGQVFTDFEVVVVDDGSTDEGPDIVKNYTDPRIYFVCQENAGPGAARNRGVSESHGSYLAFLDADDEWTPTFLEVSVRALKENSHCGLTVTSRYEDCPRKDMTSYFIESGLHSGVWSLNDNCVLESIDRIRCMLWMGSVVCRRDVFERFNGFYDRKRVTCGEDTFLWLQLLANTSLFLIMQPLAWYHSELSELGWQKGQAGVLQPYYSDAEVILKSCPVVLRSLMEAYLTLCAAQRVSELCLHGDRDTAKEVLYAFPGLKRPWLRYVKLWMKILFPGVYRMLKLKRMNLARKPVALSLL